MIKWSRRCVADRRCRVLSSDVRIRVAATDLTKGLSTYPDVTVVCGKTERAADDPLAVTNPILVVEVTSPSTEDYDREEKLTQYQRLASVKEILLVSHREPQLVLHLCKRRVGRGAPGGDVHQCLGVDERNLDLALGLHRAGHRRECERQNARAKHGTHWSSD